jgi:hypothetical protein
MKRALSVLITPSGTAAPVCVEQPLHGWVHAGTELPDVIDCPLPDWHTSLAKFRKVFCFDYYPELEGAL